jgi:NH3-dependent NAD+ synthetase
MLDFVDFIADHEMESNIRLLVFPSYFRVGNLPDNFKKEAYAICDKLEAKYASTKETRFLIESLSDMRRAINASDSHLQSFKNITKEQDKFRGMYLYDYNEKLGELVYGSNLVDK